MTILLDEHFKTQREKTIDIAERIKTLSDITMLPLKYWNYSACPTHEDIGPQVDCNKQQCGGDFFSHQRVAIMWLYTIKHGLLADDPGCGKTNSILGLIALLKERNELNKRAVIIPQTAAVGQWESEVHRWLPGIKAIAVDGSMTKKNRIALYSQNWDVLIIGSHAAINDKRELELMGPFDLVANDDVDALLTHDNATHKAITKISESATRSFTVNATVLQIRMDQLHAALVPAGGHDVFGSHIAFKNRYERKELVTKYNDKGRKVTSREFTGYRRIPELRTKLKPLYLKRKATELTDIRMPMLMPPEVKWFDMSPLQRAKYDELQQGILRLVREEGEHIKHVNVLTQFLYGQQICAGLPALKEPDGPGASPKLDWLFHHLQTVWADRKVIVFVKNVDMVRATIQRARAADINMAMIWGQKQTKEQREIEKTRFREDPLCRLMIGTTSIERSHNLQAANTVVALDTHLNPKRMEQILGRARRAGSSNDRVFMFTLLMKDTQEEKYLKVLAQRQAISDTVFEEETGLYEKLSTLELLQLMAPN